MAFKMRSGNKSSFKDMGSSPAKNIDLSSKLDIGTGLDTPDIGGYKKKMDRDASDAAQRLANKEAVKNKNQDEKIKKNSKKIKPTKAEEETAARKSRTESMNSMPWNKDVKKSLSDPTKTATSKREQRANYKAAKENARKDGKITKKERQGINRDRDKVRQETAAAKGTQSLSFNLKNAVLGGQGLQAGFDIGSKAEKIQGKMDRQDANRTSKANAKATRAKTNSEATERRSKTDIGKISNKIRKGIKDFVPNLKKTVKSAVSASKPKKDTTPAPTTSTIKKTTVKKKQNQNEGNNPKNEITIKQDKVSKTYDGSKTTTPPPSVKKEVKKADAKKPVVEKKQFKKIDTKLNAKVSSKDVNISGKKVEVKNDMRVKNKVKGVLEKQLDKNKKVIRPKNK